MDLIIYIAVSIQAINLVAIIIAAVFDIYHRKNKNGIIEVRFRRSLFYLMQLISVVMCCGFWASVDNYGDLVIKIIFGICILLSNVIAVMQRLWKLSYDPAVFVFRNSFGKKRVYSAEKYGDSDKRDLTVVAYCDNKRITAFHWLFVDIESYIYFMRSLYAYQKKLKQ